VSASHSNEPTQRRAVKHAVQVTSVRASSRGDSVTELHKDGRVSQQDIDSNKYLGRVLSQIRDAQLARDAAALHSSKKTIREKDRLEADLLRRAVGDELPDVDPDFDANLLRRALAKVWIAAVARH
jgi:hypothetical protein